MKIEIDPELVLISITTLIFIGVIVWLTVFFNSQNAKYTEWAHKCRDANGYIMITGEYGMSTEFSCVTKK